MSLVQRLFDIVRREPALLMGAAGAGVSLAADLGLHLTVVQQQSVFGAATALTAFAVRQAVTPNVRLKDPLASGLTVVQRLAALEAAVKELASTPTISS
jgi:hypothetical protein